MLRTLVIRNFVIVEQIELEFANGFSVLTGETGAGKSILIDALTLALGGRADASMVREGASKADICAEFTVPSECTAWLEQHDIECEDQAVILRRVVDNAGKSKAYINGISVTASQLRECGALLVDIHGQHAHQSLLNNDAQRTILDRHAQLESLVGEVGVDYRHWHQLREQRERYESSAKQLLLERERLEWQVNELDKLKPLSNEWQEVTSEHNRLAHAATLIEGAQSALSAISESDSPLLSQLTSIHQKLEKLTTFDEKLKEIVDILEPARIHLQEATSLLNDYLDQVELDPDRLRQIEQRVEALHSCARKFHAQPEQLTDLHATLTEELKTLGNATDLESLSRMEQNALKTYQTSAAQLSKKRKAGATQLSLAVTQAMQELSMAGGSFEIELKPNSPSSKGSEQIEFMVAGHAGVSTRPLNKVASGGELARIALAISVITSSTASTPTLIFDEVDSGIGGAVAEVVGRLMQRLSQRVQVLCVTHLAQVASQANQHYQVSKATVNDRTTSHIELLDHAARVEEIARMIGGLEITATTRKHARELLT